MQLVDRLKQRARLLKAETYALYLACRDPRTPWYAKMIIGAVVAYALSPLDLIPDFIPVIGLLDDLILVPLGLAFAVKLLPAGVLTDNRELALARMSEGKPTSRAGLAFILTIWAVSALCLLGLLMRALT